MQFQQSQVIVPERWQKWGDKCREQAPASRKWFTAVLGMFEANAAAWIEDTVPDSIRAIRVMGSEADAPAKVLDGLASNSFSDADKKAMVSAFLCRAYNAAADAESDPHVPLAVRQLIHAGRVEGW